MPPSIFQQIVLPYLSYRSLASPTRLARVFSSSTACSRAAADADPSSSTSTPISHGASRRWDYVPPISPIPYDTGHDPPLRPRSRAANKQPLAAQPHVPGSFARLGGTAAEVLAFLRSLEESKGGRQATLMMALEKIASIPDQLVEREAMEEERIARRQEEMLNPKLKLGWKKGRIRADEMTSPDFEGTPSEDLDHDIKSASHIVPLPTQPAISPPLPTSVVPVADDSPSSAKLSARLQRDHFPLVIHSLLRSRLYRLTVYHLLLTPEYAVDQPLLDRVADYMRLDGAGKLAKRLEQGWDGTNPSSWNPDVPLPHLGPIDSSIRRPPDAWLVSRRAAARPIIPDTTLAALTASYNSHLTRSLLSPKKGSNSSSAQHSSNPLTPLNNMLTTVHPLAKPSGGMRQLRQLLQKIERLEKHRSFRPDWVTANLVVKCWMSCLMANGSGWKVGSAGSRGGAGQEGEIDTRGELRGLFGFVRALFEKGLEEQAAWEQQIQDVGIAPGLNSGNPNSSNGSSSSSESHSPIVHRAPIPKPYPYPQALSYTRHVRPFANDLLRAFKRIDDRYSVGRVIEWQREMKEGMEGDRGILKNGKGPRRVEFGKRTSGRDT